MNRLSNAAGFRSPGMALKCVGRCSAVHTRQPLPHRVQLGGGFNPRKWAAPLPGHVPSSKARMAPLQATMASDGPVSEPSKDDNKTDWFSSSKIWEFFWSLYMLMGAVFYTYLVCRLGTDAIMASPDIMLSICYGALLYWNLVTAVWLLRYSGKLAFKEIDTFVGETSKVLRAFYAARRKKSMEMQAERTKELRLLTQALEAHTQALEAQAVQLASIQNSVEWMRENQGAVINQGSGPSSAKIGTMSSSTQPSREEESSPEGKDVDSVQKP